MGIVSRIGQWLDKRFPEKISADEVNQRLNHFQVILPEFQEVKRSVDSFHRLFEDVAKVQDDLNKLKLIMEIKQAGTVRMQNFTGSEAWRR